MFDFVEDLAKGIGTVIGTATCLIIGVPMLVIAETLGITVKMVKEAKDSGCETYEEIKDFFDIR